MVVSAGFYMNPCRPSASRRRDARLEIFSGWRYKHGTIRATSMRGGCSTKNHFRLSVSSPQRGSQARDPNCGQLYLQSRANITCIYEGVAALPPNLSPIALRLLSLSKVKK